MPAIYLPTILPTIFLQGALLLGAASLTGCRKSESLLAVPETPEIKQGKMVYQTYCIACHNPDPRKAGVVGPEIAFSSKELLDARVVHGKYPEGYEPKRPGKAMPAFANLASQIDALHAYLNAVKQP